jgi:prolyl 4-hydroxylase
MENSNSVEKIMGKKPQSDFNLQLIPNFISFDEAAKFIELIDKSDKIDSTIGVDGKVTTNNTRISQTVALCDCDKIVIDLKRKVAKEMGIPFNNIEPVQAQLYNVGGKFDLHQDGFDTNNLIKFGLASGNRVKTLMIYLNFDLEGGSTSFPNINESFMPFTGTAIRWDNLNDKGEPDIRAKHSGDEVKFGKKYILTFWARENEFDYEEDLRLYNEHMAEQQGLPPKFSNAEYHVIDTPTEVTNMLTTIMMSEKGNGKQETGITEITGGSKIFSLDDYPAQKNRIHELYLPIAERLSGKKLQPTYVYGLRQYGNGAVLKAHRDRIDTHQVSFSVTYFKNEDWPIELELENGKLYPIELKEGQSLYYEGARQKHGRTKPFKGTSYINMYVHYKVVDQPKPKNKSHIKMI